jgi:membrane dipeptidase
MMIDVSHASDQSFWDILRISRAPVIASHSGCRTFIPDFERNLDDNMIQAIAAKGGVIQIAFGSYFLNREFNRQGEIVRRRVSEYINENKLSEGDTASEKYYEKLRSEYPAKAGNLIDLVDQIEHVVKLVGIDYVGLGSDFDGISALPEGIADVSSYPNIIQELLKRRYSEQDIQKICGENFLRVWSEVEKLSR